MSILDRYQAYADAFEETYLDDDWSRIAPYFSENAVCESGVGDARGKRAVLAMLKAGLDGFDRLMDSRVPDFATPTVDGDTVRVSWSVTYTKGRAPDLALSGVEFATFEGDQIALLHDDLSPEAEKAMSEWLAAHGALLQGD